jgi:hypothetical protein
MQLPQGTPMPGAQPGQTGQPAQVQAPPSPPVPLADAIAKAPADLLAAAPAAGTAARPVLIDPMVDGVSGMESTATRNMVTRLGELLRKQRPDLQVQPISPAALQRGPLVLVGTFTPINLAGARVPKDAYRICLALADLGSGKVVAKGAALSTLDGVDLTPTRFYQESPTWLSEALTEAYIRTCEGTNVGDPIHPVYRQGIAAAAQIYDGITAFDAGKYREAIDAYRRALALPQGTQLRALNGLYLAHYRLGDMAGATEAFGKIVEFGLERQRLAVKFLFRPGTAAFVAEPELSGPYPMWLEQLARQGAKGSACLEVVGHTSRTGAEPINERLSLLRAETVRNRLVAIAPPLKGRTLADGVGSRQTLVGLGTDDLRDALDRRVVFVVRPCP